MSMVGQGESNKFLSLYFICGAANAVWHNLGASVQGGPSLVSVLSKWPWDLLRLVDLVVLPFLLWPGYVWAVVAELMAQWFQR